MTSIPVKEHGQTPSHKVFANILIQYFPAALALVLLIAVSFMISKKLAKEEEQKLIKSFQYEVNAHTFAFRNEIQVNLEALNSMKSFYDSSRFISRKEFSVFSQGILSRLENVKLCQWIPVVVDSDRQAYERKARREFGSDFQFWEKDENGMLIPAKQRDKYYPVYFSEPLNGNEVAVGFDMGSNPEQARTLEIAMQTLRASASSPINLLQDNIQRKASIIVQPVFKRRSSENGLSGKHISGFVLIIVYPDQMLKNVIYGFNPNQAGIEMVLTDDTDPVSQIIYRQQSPESSKALKEYEYSNALLVAGRTWTVKAYPTISYFDDNLTHFPQYVLITGILLAVLIASYLISLKRRSIVISEIVKARTEELEKIHSQLLHSEKLSAVGRLSASIAHEFNNPLYGIRSVIKGIGRRAELSPEEKQLVEMAARECDRMKKLIQELQSFNRPTSGHFLEVDVHEMIDQLLVFNKKALREKKIRVLKHYSRILPRITAIEDQIKQVILNLLTNAADACADGGVITITTDIADSNSVVIHLNDNGRGIAEEHIEKIFEPFFTTKPAKKGTGLGLSVSYGIVQHHGGDLKVVSQPGSTTFSLYLPVKTTTT